jgi:hypothetical protein
MIIGSGIYVTLRLVPQQFEAVKLVILIERIYKICH